MPKLIGYVNQFTNIENSEDLLPPERNSEDLELKENGITKTDHHKEPTGEEETKLNSEDTDKKPGFNKLIDYEPIKNLQIITTLIHSVIFML